MGDFEETYRPDDDEAILEAYRNFDENRFNEHAAAVAIEKEVSIDEVKQRAKLLYSGWQKEKEKVGKVGDSGSSRSTKNDSDTRRAQETMQSVKGAKGSGRALEEKDLRDEPGGPGKKPGKPVQQAAQTSPTWGGKEPRTADHLKKLKNSKQGGKGTRTASQNKQDMRDEPSIPRKKVEEATRKSPDLQDANIDMAAIPRKRSSPRQKTTKTTLTESSEPNASDASATSIPRKKKAQDQRSSPRKSTAPDFYASHAATSKPNAEKKTKEKKKNRARIDEAANKPRSTEKKAKIAQRKSGKSGPDNSEELNDLEIEFAWLVEESMLHEGNRTNRLAFWFVELHASNELKRWIDHEKEMAKDWKKSGKIKKLIKGKKIHKFDMLREKIRHDLRNGKRRKETEEHLPKPGQERKWDDEELDDSYISESESPMEARSRPQRRMVAPPHHIKPLHKIGDRVYACWLHDKEQESNYFPGTVRGFQVHDKHGTYGEARFYDILFDDGDKDPHLEDIFVRSIKDYMLIEEYDLPKNGVKANKRLGDRYAEEIGWFTTQYTGDKVFAFLSDAVEAHDKAVVNMKRELTLKSDLLYPKDWKFSSPLGTKAPVFAEAPLEGYSLEDSESDGDNQKSTQTHPTPKKKRRSIDRSRSKRRADSSASSDLIYSPEEESKEDGTPDARFSKRRKSGLADISASKKKKTKRRFRVDEDGSVAENEHAEKEAKENSLRFDLAVAHRLTAKFGMDMLAWNHISARFGTGCLISPRRRMAAVFTPDDVVFKSSDDIPDVIHEAVYKARPDVNAIVHLQSPAATAVSCLQEGFRFLTLDSAYFYNKLATYSVNRTTDDESEKQDIIAAVLSVKGCNTLLMHNHGFVSFGSSVREAWVLAWHFERCCEIQLNVMKSGGEVITLSEEVMAEAAESGSDPEFAPGNEWDSLCELVSFE